MQAGYKSKKRPLVIIHAPNHRNLKGTDFIKEKIDDLNRRGFHIKLKILAGVNNQKILNAIDEADIVLDQLIIGWYAVFSIEGMAYSKGSLYNKENTLHADMTKSQSNYMDIRRCL